MKISVWGNELIGWTAASAFAEFGNLVHINQHLKKQQSLLEQTGANTILHSEYGLLDRVNSLYEQGNLIFGNIADALQCPIQILALHPDRLEFAKEIIEAVKQRQTQQLIIINYSTFGLGTTDTLQDLLEPEKNQAIAYIPDQLSEGSAYNTFVNAKTLVIGCEDPQAIIHIKALYKPFSQKLDQLLIVNPREAEFMKFAVNGMLALRLGYINELANLADQLNIDIQTIISGMSSDPRIGRHYLSPGCGFGGAYFSKSIQNMANLLQKNRKSIILNTVLDENEKQKLIPFRKLWQHYKTNIKNKKIAVWGLSFKPNTASIEKAPSIDVINTLISQGCYIKAHDPQAINNFRAIFPESEQLHYCNHAIDTLNDADALIILTEWNEYWSPDYHQMQERMKYPLIIDGRNILDREIMKEFGFVYYGIGR